MAQQTAVEWLVQEINKLTGLKIVPDEPIIDQAKQMEKENIKKAFSDGQELSINNPLLPHYSSEEYYNDNYNK